MCALSRAHMLSIRPINMRKIALPHESLWQIAFSGSLIFAWFGALLRHTSHHVIQNSLRWADSSHISWSACILSLKRAWGWCKNAWRCLYFLPPRGVRGSALMSVPECIWLVQSEQINPAPIGKPIWWIKMWSTKLGQSHWRWISKTFVVSSIPRRKNVPTAIPTILDSCSLKWITVIIG